MIPSKTHPNARRRSKARVRLATARLLKPPQLFEEILTLFTRPATISDLQVVTDHFRLITLQGDDLKTITWTPGQKVQIIFHGSVPRTYTPISWDSVRGITRFLVYARGTTSPGSVWVKTAEVGEIRHIWGPRQSLNLTELTRPALFFGDETSFGLAYALQATRGGLQGITFLFEVSSAAESAEVLRGFGITDPTLVERSNHNEHVAATDTAVHRLIESVVPEHFLLTGNASSIRRLTKLLRSLRIPLSKLKVKAHWENGKTGLD